MTVTKNIPFWKNNFYFITFLMGIKWIRHSACLFSRWWSWFEKFPETPVFSYFPSDPPFSLSIFWLKYWENCSSATWCCLDHWQNCFTTAGAIVSHGESDDPEYFLGRCAQSCSRSQITAVVLGLLKHLLSLFFNSEKETGNWLLRKYLNVILFSIYSWKHLESSNGSYAVGCYS